MVPVKNRDGKTQYILINHGFEENSKGLRIFEYSDVEPKIHITSKPYREFFIAKNLSEQSSYLIEIVNESNGNKKLKVYDNEQRIEGKDNIRFERTIITSNEDPIQL